MRVSRWAIGGVAGLALAMAGPSAEAKTAFSYVDGKTNYSWNSADRHTIYAYDGASDGCDIAVDYYKTGSSIEYSAQTQGGKGQTVNRGVDTLVYKHRAVQLIPAQPDSYGAWAYPQ